MLIFNNVPMKGLFAQIKTEEQFYFDLMKDGPEKQAIVDATMKDISIKIYKEWCPSSVPNNDNNNNTAE